MALLVDAEDRSEASNRFSLQHNMGGMDSDGMAPCSFNMLSYNVPIISVSLWLARPFLNKQGVLMCDSLGPSWTLKGMNLP